MRTRSHYKRVMPRDAFNEGNLLKCLGRLFLLLDDRKDTQYTLVHEFIDRPFCIVQDETSGDITCSNVYMMLYCAHYLFWRPINSREPWPLFIETMNDDVISVFDEHGDLTTEFKEFIGYD